MVSEVQRTVHAPLDKVWAIAGDFSKSPDTSLPTEIVCKGDEANGRVGCERKIKMGALLVHERLDAIDPPNSYTYSMLSGSPVKYYRGKVAFTAEGENTRIRWSVEFAPKIPGTGWLINKINIKNYKHFIDELEKQL